MKIPRFRIGTLMVVVLLVALDFALGKALMQHGLLPGRLRELLLVGAFPMGNVLVVGIAALIAGRLEARPPRPALVGFVAFGLASWVTFVACSILAPDETRDLFNGAIMASRLRPGLALASFAASAFTLPQLALAALGWWLGGRYVFRWVLRWPIVVERRAVG